MLGYVHFNKMIDNVVIGISHMCESILQISITISLPFLPRFNGSSHSSPFQPFRTGKRIPAHFGFTIVITLKEDEGFLKHGNVAEISSNTLLHFNSSTDAAHSLNCQTTCL
jgi:hypothetical protein